MHKLSNCRIVGWWAEFCLPSFSPANHHRRLPHTFSKYLQPTFSQPRVQPTLEWSLRVEAKRKSRYCTRRLRCLAFEGLKRTVSVHISYAQKWRASRKRRLKHLLWLSNRYEGSLSSKHRVLPEIPRNICTASSYWQHDLAAPAIKKFRRRLKS